jgi:hypothetical protein
MKIVDHEIQGDICVAVASGFRHNEFMRFLFLNVTCLIPRGVFHRSSVFPSFRGEFWFSYETAPKTCKCNYTIVIFSHTIFTMLWRMLRFCSGVGMRWLLCGSTHRLIRPWGCVILLCETWRKWPWRLTYMNCPCHLNAAFWKQNEWKLGEIL